MNQDLESTFISRPICLSKGVDNSRVLNANKAGFTLKKGIRLMLVSLLAYPLLTAQSFAAVRIPGTFIIYGYPKSSVNLNSSQDEMLLNEIDANLQKGNLAGAEYAIRQFIKLEPQSIERARFIAYRLLDNQHNSDNDLKWLQNVLNYKDANSRDYYYAAYFQTDNKNYSSALYYAQQGLMRNPDAYLRLGYFALISECYMKTGDLGAARNYFNKFKATLKNLPPATGKGKKFIEAIGNALIRLSNRAYDAEPSHEMWDQTLSLQLDYLNWAIRSAPTEAEFYKERAKYLADKKEFKRAFDDYSKAVQLDPQDRHSLSRRSSLLMNELNSPLSAIEGFSKLIVAMEKLAESTDLDTFEVRERSFYYVMRGYAFSRLGDCEKALRDMMKACELGNEESCLFTCRL
ncbi:MAG: hypothetical protein ACO1RX_20490 [Candidatus Sericytochromatia bacterium]